MAPVFPVRCSCSQRTIGRYPGVGQDDSDQKAVVLAATGQTAAYYGATGQTQATLQQRAQDMEESIKKNSIKSAMVNTGLQLGVAAIPGVGQALAGVMGLVSLAGGQRYKEKLEKHIASKVAEMNSYIAAKQQELDSALSSAYAASFQRGVKLANSWQPLTMDASEPGMLKREEKKVSVEGLGAPWDKMTGKDDYDKARRKVDQMTDEAKRTTREAADPIIAEVGRDGFRALLAKQIAMAIRETGPLAKAFETASPTRYTGAQAPTPTGAATISVDTSPFAKVGILAAAVGGAILLLKR